MGRPSPEEQARMTAEKEAKKAAKKAKFGAANEERNLPVVEVRLPWTNSETGKDIDIEKAPWDSLVDRAEEHYRLDPCFTRFGNDYSQKYMGPVKRRIIRT
jgi:hypothetical protein